MIPLFRVHMAEAAAPAVAEVLASGYIGQGPKVDRFEGELKRVLDAERDILTLNSCTSALDLALTLAGVGPGDVVVSTPMTCSATNSPIVTRGAQIAWADVDPVTGLIDPASVARVCERLMRTGGHAAAVVAVDWAGRMCDYNALRDTAHHYSAEVIEDAAHSPLATKYGRYQTHVGGDYIAWSFQAIKHLTTGDGGAIQCSTASRTERARLLRWYGLDRKSKADFRCEQDIDEVGFKYHMNDVAAAIGLANLPHLGGLVFKHRANARYYDAALADLPPERITLPPADNGSSYWLYTVLVEDRPSFEAALLDAGIATSQVHRRNDHHTAFKAAEHPASEERPGLEHFASRQISIPVGWWLTDAEREHVAATVRKWALR